MTSSNYAHTLSLICPPLSLSLSPLSLSLSPLSLSISSLSLSISPLSLYLLSLSLSLSFCLCLSVSVCLGLSLSLSMYLYQFLFYFSLSLYPIESLFKLTEELSWWTLLCGRITSRMSNGPPRNRVNPFVAEDIWVLKAFAVMAEFFCC